MARRSISINKELVFELYNRGVSAKKIAELGGIHHVTVHQIIAKCKKNSSTSSYNLSNQHELSNEQVQKIVDLIVSGSETKDIKKEAEVSAQVVNKIRNIVVPSSEKITLVKESKVKEAKEIKEEKTKTEKDEIKEMYIDLLKKGYKPKDIVKVYNKDEDKKYYSYQQLCALLRTLPEKDQKSGYASNVFPKSFTSYKNGDENPQSVIGNYDKVVLVYADGSKHVRYNVTKKQLNSFEEKVRSTAQTFVENNKLENLIGDDRDYYIKYCYFDNKHKKNYQQLTYLASNGITMAKQFLSYYRDIFVSFNEYQKLLPCEIEAIENTASNIIRIFSKYLEEQKKKAKSGNSDKILISQEDLAALIKKNEVLENKNKELNESLAEEISVNFTLREEVAYLSECIDKLTKDINQLRNSQKVKTIDNFLKK